DPADADIMLSAMSQWAMFLAPEDPRKPGAMLSVGKAKVAKFRAYGGPATLDSAISFLTHAGELASSGVLFASCLHALWEALSARFELSGNVEDLDFLISVAEILTSPSGPDHHLPRSLSALSNAFQMRYQANHVAADLGAAVRSARAAVAAAGQSDCD